MGLYQNIWSLLPERHAKLQRLPMENMCAPNWHMWFCLLTLVGCDKVSEECTFLQNVGHHLKYYTASQASCCRHLHRFETLKSHVVLHFLHFGSIHYLLLGLHKFGHQFTMASKIFVVALGIFCMLFRWFGVLICSMLKYAPCSNS